MAKQVTGNYYYLNKNGEIINDSHPGRDKKTGNPKPPHGIKGVQCWTEIGSEFWYYPDGLIKEESKDGQIKSILVVEDEELVKILNEGTYASRMRVEKDRLFHIEGKGLEGPFWRYAISEEWKPAWRDEWAQRANGSAFEWWRAELRAFLSVVKDLVDKGINAGEMTDTCIEIIRERFSKKKEEAV